MRSIIIGITLCLASTSILFAQQTGTIKGRIVDNSQQPISYVNVGLVGTTFGDATNGNGEFVIKNIPAETYRLKISAVGYKTEEKRLTVKSGQTLTVKATLFTENGRLPEIVVTGNQINKFTTQISSYVGKMPIDRIDNPQVYNTVTSQLLESQVVTDFADALTNAPGIFKLWESTGRTAGSAYFSLRGFPVQPTMINGLPALTSGTLDPANIKRIEIIKGPSGTLYGSSLISYGGLINVVTKKPYNHLGGQLSYTGGSFGLHRFVADINTPVGNEENIFARFIGAYHKQNSFQDTGFKNSVFIAPSVSYDVNDRLSFLVQTVYYDEERTNSTMLFLNRGVELEFENLNELSYDYTNSFTNDDIVISNNTFHLQAQMRYQLADNWLSQTAFSKSAAESDGYYTYLWDLQAYNRTFARYVSDQNSTLRGLDIQQNFIGSFSLGAVHNKVVIGFDYFRNETINNNSGYAVADRVKLTAPDTNRITLTEVRGALAEVPLINTTSLQKTYSAYISDVINFTPQLSAMLSLRIDRFINEGNAATADDDFSQTALSPKFGLIYQPIDNKLSLFANYMNGFNNVAPITQGDGSIKVFEPEKAIQWETGIKANLFGRRLVATLSYYDIHVSNVVRPDPNRVNFFVQDGENYSRGFEVSAAAVPIPNLNIIAGYSYNQSKILTTSNASFSFKGRRPEGAGPKHLANFWATYQFSEGLMRGVGLGFGGNYASKNLIFNRPIGVFALPSFTVFNASVFYNTNSYRIDLKVDNLADEIYYKGWATINPQQPRSITASFSYKF